MPPVDTVVFEDARIVFRNFTGKEGLYNAEGDRTFCILLDDDIAATMDRDGWNIKTLKAREDDEEGTEQPYIQVSLKYRGRNGRQVRPPRVVMITSRGRTDLGEDEVEALDWVDIQQVDCIIRPYEWAVNGKGGIKAYLKSLFVTINEDPLELKYGDVERVPSVRAGAVDE